MPPVPRNMFRFVIIFNVVSAVANGILWRMGDSRTNGIASIVSSITCVALIVVYRRMSYP